MAGGQSEGIYASLQRSPHHPDLLKSPHELENDLSLDSQPNFDEELGLTHSDLQFLHDSHPFEGLPDSILDHLDVFSDIWAGNDKNGGSGHKDTVDIDTSSNQNNAEGVNDAPCDINQPFRALSPSAQEQLDELLRGTLGLPSTSDRPTSFDLNEILEDETRKRPTSCNPSSDGAIGSPDDPHRMAKRQCTNWSTDLDNRGDMVLSAAGEVSREPAYTAGETPESNDSLGTAFSSKPDDLDSLFSECDLDLEETVDNPTTGSDLGSGSIQCKSPMQSAPHGKASDSSIRFPTQHPLTLPKSAHQVTPVFIQALAATHEGSHTPTGSLFHETPTADLSKGYQHLNPPFPLASNPLYQQPLQNTPSISCQILENSGLQDQDLVSTKLRDVIRNPQVVTKYISPYPRVGGSLGYLPSNPTLHVKCVEVAQDEVVARLESYRKNVRALSREKNKYMWENQEWKRANLGASKPTEQILKEELTSLKRTLNAKEKKTKEALDEAALWRDGYRNLALAYSNLLRRLAPPPAVYRPATTPTITPIPNTPATPQPSRNGSPSDSSTVDLTIRRNEKEAPAINASRPPSPQPNVEALVAMQKRQYNWLPGQKSLHKPILPRPTTNNNHSSREHSQPTPSASSSRNNGSGNQSRPGELTGATDASRLTASRAASVISL